MSLDSAEIVQECATLGCAGDNLCHQCARGVGAIPRIAPELQPAVAAAMPFADMFVPEPWRAPLKTAVGISTPVSEEDLNDFAELIEAWARINAAPGASGSLKSRISAHRRSYEAFLKLWNAAQRDPAELRRQLQIAQQLLSALESAQSMTGGRTPRIRIPRKTWSKAAVGLAIGGAAAVVGGTIAIIAGRK